MRHTEIQRKEWSNMTDREGCDTTYCNQLREKTELGIETHFCKSESGN